MCLLFETIRVEQGRVHHLDYHQQRVARSVLGNRINLVNYLKNTRLPQSGCFKLRIVYSSEGIVEHQLTPYTVRRFETLKLVDGGSIRYDKKYLDRSVIDKLRETRGECDDILIVRDGILTDTSIANIVLFDGSRWITPAKPLLAGTCRARLIEEGTITTADITPDSLTKYAKISLINAMIGFNPNCIGVNDITIV